MSKMTGRAVALAYEFAEGLSVIADKRKLKNLTIVAATRGVAHLTFNLHLADPTQLKLITSEETLESIALACGVGNISAYRDENRVRLMFSLPENMWQECMFSSTEGLGVGLGDGRVQVDHSYEIPHTLIAGTTGSGKTIAAQALVLATIRELGDSVDYVVVDPHRQFTFLENCPLVAYPLAHEQEEINSALEYAYGQYVLRKMKGFDPEEMRRIVIVCDEAQEVIQGQALELMQRLTSGGRKYGINCVIATQKPSEKALPDVLSNLGVRYVGLVTSARVSSELTGHAGLGCHKLRGQGEFIKVFQGLPSKFQIGMVNESDFDNVPRGQRPSSLQSPKVLDASMNRTRESVTSQGEGVSLEPTKQRPQTVNQTLEQYVDKTVGGRGRGQPIKNVEPQILIQYFTSKMTVTKAKTDLGLSQAMHYRYAQFASDMRQEAKRSQ